MEYTLTLTCGTCGVEDTLIAKRRSDLIVALDSSTWKTEPTPDGTGHIATCGNCTPIKRTHAEHAQAVFA